MLDLAGAVEAEWPDGASPRTTATRRGTAPAGRGAQRLVDRSHRGVLRVSGPDRLTWLHSFTSQHLEALKPGAPSRR